MMSGKHQPLYITLLIVTWILLLLTFFFNGLSSVDATSLKWGIFQSTTGNISDEFYLEITPAGWTFTIWGFIYAYQVIWMLYATASLFRKATDGTPLYTVGPAIHWSVFVVYIINNICNISWILLWDRKHLIAALVPISIIAFTMYIAVAISIYGAYKYYPLLIENGFKYEHRLILGMVSNAFAMYGTWVTVATLLNFGMVLTYNAGVAQPASSAAALSILTFEIMVWVLVDLSFFEKYTRFIFTPYLVLVVALSGSISKNYNGTNPNSVLTVTLLVAALLMLAVKIALVTRRELKKPAFGKEKSKVDYA